MTNGLIKKETALAIALAYQEIERGEKLLMDVTKCIEQRKERWPDANEDLRNVFGHRARSLTLGIPSGENAHRLCDVSYELALPVINAHIANKRSTLSALCIQAASEMRVPPVEGE